MGSETYMIRTFGCQMNKHDSERVAGMLTARGLCAVDNVDDADVVVFMTCCVRENAEERLYGQVASLKNAKSVRPGQLIAVGGCIGQRDGERLLARAPHVDIVFGTHNISHLPALLEAAERRARPCVEILSEGPGYIAELPTEREHPWHAWVPVTVGCDNHCTYCIVPKVRGTQRSRELSEVAAEVERLVAEGVLEITLLGQNVNSYGLDRYGDVRFAELLGAVAQTGIPRIRFVTSHPKDLSDDTIDAMASLDNVMPSLHLPMQSGSNRILSAMNRVYDRTHYLALVDKLYAALPGLALSTDVIVGFPGEDDDDFDDTLGVVERARFDQVFTFIYSVREGTPAARMTDQVPRAVSQERFDRLVEVVHRSALEKNRPYVGTVQQVLVEGSSKRDSSMLAGRTETNKLVHAPLPHGLDARDLAGSFAHVVVESAHTWFLAGQLAGTENP